MTIEQQILKRIDKEKKGTIFINADFLDLAESNTLRKSLKRLVDEGMITRIMDGMYAKLEYSNILKKQIFPSPINVAHTLARKFNWSIYPSKNTALNITGLSTQISNAYEFLSDGPYRKYKYLNTQINFKKSANKKIKINPESLATLIIALDAYGKDKIKDREINIVDTYLNENNITENTLEQNKTIPEWMYTVIKNILKKDEQL